MPVLLHARSVTYKERSLNTMCETVTVTNTT